MHTKYHGRYTSLLYRHRNSALLLGLILTLFLAELIVGHLLETLLDDPPPLSHFDNISKGEIFVFGVIIAPLLETLIFQLLIFWVPSRLGVLKFLEKKGLVFVLLNLSATLFALSHWYDTSYLIRGFVAGYILAWFFYKKLLQSGFEPAYILIAVGHALHNGIVMILTEVM